VRRLLWSAVNRRSASAPWSHSAIGRFAFSGFDRDGGLSGIARERVAG